MLLHVNPTRICCKYYRLALGEMVEFASGVKGIALNLENENVGSVRQMGATSLHFLPQPQMGLQGTFPLKI